jgi:predicted dehydrogenase
MDTIPTTVNYQPQFPATYRPRIGLLGCGSIAKTGHLPAYQKYGLQVAGVYDPRPEAVAGVREQFGVEKIYSSEDELLANPEIEVVDIATHPPERVGLMKKALLAGKHVLSEKPFVSDLQSAREIIALAESQGLNVAVNQSGRWAPPWRVATLLIQQGYLGDPFEVTHLFDVNFAWWIPGTVFDTLKNYEIYDYAIHWIDITRCWMGEKKVAGVRAREYRTPHQPAESIAPYGMWIELAYADGSNAMIRSVGTAETQKGGHLFWVHGSAGTIRGSVQLGSDHIELEKGGVVARYHLEGTWYPDGFAGAMGELLSAIEEQRQPFHSARHNLLSLQLTLAACRSSDQDGALVTIPEIEEVSCLPT